MKKLLVFVPIVGIWLVYRFPNYCAYVIEDSKIFWISAIWQGISTYMSLQLLITIFIKLTIG